jgi:hypothetical protein
VADIVVNTRARAQTFQASKPIDGIFDGNKY